MARRSPRAPTEPFAAAPHALGERRAASRGRYPPAALLRHARHACAVAGRREYGGSGCEYGDESAPLREKECSGWCGPARVPRSGAQGERSVGKCCARCFAHAILSLGRQRGEVVTGGSDREGEGIPEVLEARIVDGRLELAVFDVLQAGAAEAFGDVALR